MKQFQYVITDPEGMHARPAGLLVKEANRYASSVLLGKGGKTADAKRIFAVMGLAAKKGELLDVQVEGADEETAAQSIKRFLKENL